MTAFWDMATCNLVEVDRSFRDTYCLHHRGDVFIALMMEAVRTSETSAYFNETILHGAITKKALIFIHAAART
jgi:hypothetical protein